MRTGGFAVLFAAIELAFILMALGALIVRGRRRGASDNYAERAEGDAQPPSG